MNVPIERDKSLWPPCMNSETSKHNANKVNFNKWKINLLGRNLCLREPLRFTLHHSRKQKKNSINS